MKQNIIIFFLLILSCTSAFSETIFTYRFPESPNDQRYDYDRQLLELALKKTEKKYGAYKLIPSANGVNEKRTQLDAKTQRYENFFFKQSITPEMLAEFDYVPFPVDRGIVGYRIAFVSSELKEKLKSITQLEDLKKLQILQGVGWVDADILRLNGFAVTLVSQYESMFKMVSRNRADLFLRGANELHDEWIAHQTIPNLTYDESIVIYYPLPRFLFTTKGNTDAVKRIHEGIIIAYNDGSLINLWRQEYQKSINFSNLKNRRIFKLKNPFLENIDKSFMQYNYDPFE